MLQFSLLQLIKVGFSPNSCKRSVLIPQVELSIIPNPYELDDSIFTSLPKCSRENSLQPNCLLAPCFILLLSAITEVLIAIVIVLPSLNTASLTMSIP